MPKSNGRDQILQAALMTFAEKGYDGASIRDIAHTAQLSLSALYYYFPSKQEALFALIHTAYANYNERTSNILKQVRDDVNAQVAYGVQHLVNYRCTNIMSSRVVLLESGRLEGKRHEQVRIQQRKARSLLENVVDRGRREGAFDITDPVLATRSINAMCNAIPQWYRPEGTYTPEYLTRQYVFTAFRMLGSEQALNLDPFFDGRVDASAQRLDPVPDARPNAKGPGADEAPLPPS